MPWVCDRTHTHTVSHTHQHNLNQTTPSSHSPPRVPGGVPTPVRSRGTGARAAITSQHTTCGDGDQWGGGETGRGGEGGGYTARTHKHTTRKPPTMARGAPHPRTPPQSSQGASSPRDSTHKISVLCGCGSHVCMGEGAGAGAPQAQGWRWGHAAARGDTPTLCMATRQTGAPRPNPHSDSSATATHVLGTARYHACV